MSVALLFAAKSTTDKRGSIPTQLADARALAERDQLEVVAQFTDEAASAYHGDRGPGLASALAEAERRAADGQDVSLIVQHSDRLARGDGKSAKHLVEYALWALKAGVKIRSVQDPEMFPEGDMSLLLSTIGGMRNYEDSKRKAAATRDGMARSRERGDAGWLLRGIKPDGYAAVRTFEGGQVQRQVIKDPERKAMFELLFKLALEGHSAHAIELELASRGYRTAPVKRGQRPRPIDVHWINQKLANPLYAGYVTHKGRIVGEGDWPRYIEPDDWHRLQAERKARASATQRQPGRPPEGYLLSGLAVCGECGRRLQATTYRKHRKDAAPIRRYVCPGHRDHAERSPHYCPVKAFDAPEVDRLVLRGIDGLLADADALRSQLGAGHRAERTRLEDEVAKAREDVAKAERVVERAMARYEAALAAEDDEGADINLTAVRRARQDAAAARTRQDAALDALSAPVEVDDGDVLQRIWEALSGRCAECGDDVQKLNVALREHFDQFELRRDPEGNALVTPRLSMAALARVIRSIPTMLRRASAELGLLDIPGEELALFSKNSHWRTWASSYASSGRYGVPWAKWNRIALDSPSGRPSSRTRVGTRRAGLRLPSSSARFERSTTSTSCRS